jgi:hypothetical protein
MLLEELTSYCYWLATATGSDYGSDTAPIITSLFVPLK